MHEQLLDEWDRVELLLRDEWLEETGRVAHVTLDDDFMGGLDAYLVGKCVIIVLVVVRVMWCGVMTFCVLNYYAGYRLIII